MFLSLLICRGAMTSEQTPFADEDCEIQFNQKNQNSLASGPS